MSSPPSAVSAIALTSTSSKPLLKLDRPFSSIAARLLFASALLLPLFLGLTGFFLDRAFENSLTVAEHSRLRGHINLLFSVAELDTNNPKGTGLRLPLTLREADFERPDSGLYGYIFNDQKELDWHSNSASLRTPPSYARIARDSRPGQMVIDTLVMERKLYFVARYDIFWEDDEGKSHPFLFAVLHSGAEYKAELKVYRRELWRWLGAAGVFLLMAQVVILRWGLRPLGKLAIALKAMQSGDTSNIAGHHPKELQKVVNNLNQVLEREQALRQRYRDSLANLAHSLKTPLAVLQSKLNQSDSEEELRQIANEQVARMNQVVTYQLQRAVSSQQSGTVRRTRLEPLVQRLFSALNKVYSDKQIEHSCQLSPNSTVIGDEQDIMELLGNLLENAFKYGHGKVSISSKEEEDNFVVEIEDDGPGVPEEERERILQRGQRLDTNKPGQGIGLAVAAEIVRSYDGRIEIQTSSLGGAKFIVHLPNIH
jgi:two-component system, OmpR family, sensor histidine kinase PhoQ